MDANATYTLGPIGIQLNLDNLSDEKYAAGSYNAIYVLPGRPRRTRIMLT